MGSEKIKIAILECDSGHTEAYSMLTNFANSPFAKKANVNCIYSSDLELAKKKAHKLNIPKVTEDISDALKDIDCAMVIGRYADSHFFLAKTALLQSVPVFIDKPFVENSSQAAELISISKEENTPMMACSPFRFDEGLINFKKERQKGKVLQRRSMGFQLRLQAGRGKWGRGQVAAKSVIPNNISPSRLRHWCLGQHSRTNCRMERSCRKG